MEVLGLVCNAMEVQYRVLLVHQIGCLLAVGQLGVQSDGQVLHARPAASPWWRVTRETIKPGETGLIVDCTRPERPVRTLAQLPTDVNRCQHMGQAGGNWVFDRFNWLGLASRAKVLFDQMFLANVCNSGPKSQPETAIAQ